MEKNGSNTHDGRSFRILTVIDEYTKECLALPMARRLRSDDVLACLTDLFTKHGPPDHIRSDNGPEFVAKAIQQWLSSLDVRTLYVAPGSPWQNGYAESFHSRLRDELLSLEEFDSVRHARAHSSAWREDYNGYRPHSSLGGLPPNSFAQRCTDSATFTARTPLHQHSDTTPVTQPVLS